jgi:hypothetical protein
VDIDTTNDSLKGDGTISQMVTSGLPGLSGLAKTVGRGERKRVLRALKNEERREATKAAEVSQVLTGSVRVGRKPTKHADEVLFFSPIV